MTPLKTLIAAALLAASLSPALAQDHSGHQMPAATETTDPAALGYKAAMDTMMTTMMNEKPSGSADIDFVRGMIPHHQAAIDMAKVQLHYGKDPVIRKLSEEIIAAQEGEIKMMQEWLAKNGG